MAKKALALTLLFEIGFVAFLAWTSHANQAFWITETRYKPLPLGYHWEMIAGAIFVLLLLQSLVGKRLPTLQTLNGRPQMATAWFAALLSGFALLTAAVLPDWDICLGLLFACAPMIPTLSRIARREDEDCSEAAPPWSFPRWVLPAWAALFFWMALRMDQSFQNAHVYPTYIHLGFIEIGSDYVSSGFAYGPFLSNALFEWFVSHLEFTRTIYFSMMLMPFLACLFLAGIFLISIFPSHWQRPYGRWTWSLAWAAAIPSALTLVIFVAHTLASRELTLMATPFAFHVFAWIKANFFKREIRAAPASIANEPTASRSRQDPSDGIGADE